MKAPYRPPFVEVAVPARPIAVAVAMRPLRRPRSLRYREPVDQHDHLHVLLIAGWLGLLLFGNVPASFAFLLAAIPFWLIFL
jgi:hypothetical protein